MIIFLDSQKTNLLYREFIFLSSGKWDVFFIQWSSMWRDKLASLFDGVTYYLSKESVRGINREISGRKTFAVGPITV